jgi:nucleoside-diphosphate-sugar epimerase
LLFVIIIIIIIMHFFVTGGTGNIGYALMVELLRQDHAVIAMVRNKERANELFADSLPHPSRLELVEGDITKPATLQTAFQKKKKKKKFGDDDDDDDDELIVVHCAGIPESAAPKEAFHTVNVQGTQNMLQACCKASSMSGGGFQITRFIYMSTMDVFGAAPGGTLKESNELNQSPQRTPYEQSKVRAQEIVHEFARRAKQGGGAHPIPTIVSICPSAVFGPSPVTTGMNANIRHVLLGMQPVCPWTGGGVSVVYNGDVALATLQAATKGDNGDLFLVSDVFWDIPAYIRAVQRAAKAEGIRSCIVSPVPVPTLVLKIVAYLTTPLFQLAHATPLLAPTVLQFILWGVHVDASLAKEKLGFVARPTHEALRSTLRDMCRRDAKLGKKLKRDYLTALPAFLVP